MSDEHNHGPNGSDQDPESFVDEVSDKAQNALSSFWNSKPMRVVRWPLALSGITTAFKVAAWGVKRESPFLKVTAPLTAAFGLAAYLGAAAYGLSYGYVAANDMTSFLNWPATQGDWSGKITRFSEKGTWPCNSYEGNLRTGEAADSELFAVRKFDVALIDAINNRPQGVDVTLVYRDNGIPQESFGQVFRDAQGEFQRVEPSGVIGCIQHSDHTAVGIHYTVPGTGQHVSVGLKPGGGR